MISAPGLLVGWRGLDVGERHHSNGLAPPLFAPPLMPAHVRKAFVTFVLPARDTLIGFAFPTVTSIVDALSIASNIGA